MKARINPDALDLEAVKATVESTGYRIIAQRRDEAIVAVMRKLAAASTWEQVCRLQGELIGLRASAAIPGVLADEFRKKPKNALET